ncbi:MAG: DNA polymerase III subunit delta' [Pseudomonadota bacterium]
MTVFSNIPAVSEPLPWQSDSWRMVREEIEHGRLPHALMVSGPEHIGKSRFTLALARLLLCSAPMQGSNCGRCHACLLSASGTHGDLMWILPEEKSRVIKIDQVRELVDFTGKTASFGQRKVAVVSPAESMNKNAANALLKVLEEPPADTHLLLVSHRPHLLPSTVRSRCQSLRLSIPSVEASENWLRQHTGETAEARELLEAANNLPMLAETLIAEDGSATTYAQTQAMNAFINGHLGSAELKPLLSDCEPLQILNLLLAGIQTRLRSLDSVALTRESARAAFRMMDELYDLQRAVNAGSNPNKLLLIDSLLAKVQGKLGENEHSDNIERKERGILS